MQPTDRERRQDRTPEESRGLAARSLREEISVDELDLRLENRDESVGPDASRVDDLCDSAKQKLLAMAGYTTEKAAAELKPAHSPATSPNAAAEGNTQAPEKALTVAQKDQLFITIQNRIQSDSKRYKGIEWTGPDGVKNALEAADAGVLYGLSKMEENGHEVGVKFEVRAGRKGFRFDSCSALSPAGVRNVDYPRAEEIAEKEWGVPLMPREVFEELQAAGIITERGTWSHLKRDAEMLTAGLSWCGDVDGVYKNAASNPDPDGGFRCSLWVPAV